MGVGRRRAPRPLTARRARPQYDGLLVESLVAKSIAAECDKIMPGDRIVEVNGTTTKGMGKAEALRVVEERYGITPERVCAVGDADNDLPMLRAAGLGVAMGNALPEIQAEADLVIGANDTDAIAALVDGLLAGEVAPAAGS